MSICQKPAPAKPRSFVTKIAEDGDVISLTVRDGAWDSRFCLGLFLAVWTVGCVLILWTLVTRSELVQFLIATPFWSSWFGVATLLADHWYGQHQLLLGPSGLFHEKYVIRRLSHRNVPLAELFRFQVAELYTNDGDAIFGIKVTTLGQPVKFGEYIPEKERDWIAHRLDEHLQRLRQQAGLDTFVDGDLPDCKGCQKPSDCRWDIEDVSTVLAFFQCGRLCLENFLTLAVLAGCWNGLFGGIAAGMFGLDSNSPAPIGAKWWWIFLFLIPFEAIGVGIFAYLSISFLEPFRVTRWFFYADGIEQITTRFGLPLGTHRQFRFSKILSATICDDLDKINWLRTISNSSEAKYSLLLSGIQNAEICTIKGLTLGEARWMKGHLQTRGYI